MTGTSERQPARGGTDSKSFFDGGVGHHQQQHQELLMDGQGSSFATPGVVAAVCMLLAMLLVGALVWVHVREALHLGRTGKRKGGRTTDEEEKKSESTSRDQDGRTGKARGDWGEQRRGQEEASLSEKVERTERKETLSAEEDQEEEDAAAAGGFWPARKGRRSSTARRTGALALQQHAIGTVGGGDQQREKERDLRRERDQAVECSSKKTESRDAEGKVLGAQKENLKKKQQQPRRVLRRTVADDGDNSTSALSSDDCITDRFQQSETKETTEKCFNTGRSTGRRTGGSAYLVGEPQWHRVDSPMGCGDTDGASRSTSSVTYHSHREVAHCYKGSNGSTSSAAREDAGEFYEEGTPNMSSSLSDEQNVLSSSEAEDHFSPTPDQGPAQSDLPWFSTQVRSSRSSAAIVSLQQQYEKKCRDLFARLGKVVEEAPAKAQTPAAPHGKTDEQQREALGTGEGTSKTSSGNSEQQRRQEEEPFRFDRPAPLSEEAMTEAEQLLMHLQEMFADIQRDFKDNQPGIITCMIRCCNSLLEMDGLMVLSRCKKVPRLMQKAQSVIETVVPCIWSS